MSDSAPAPGKAKKKQKVSEPAGPAYRHWNDLAERMRDLPYQMRDADTLEQAEAAGKLLLEALNAGAFGPEPRPLTEEEAAAVGREVSSAGYMGGHPLHEIRDDADSEPAAFWITASQNWIGGQVGHAGDFRAYQWRSRFQGHCWAVAGLLHERAREDAADHPCLSGRAMEMLQALYNGGAETPDSLMAMDDVAEAAGWGSNTGANHKDVPGELADAGLILSRGGRGGGYWLTGFGRDVAAMLFSDKPGPSAG